MLIRSILPGHRTLGLALVLWAATPALADTLTVTLAGSYIESITAGGVTVSHHDLIPGASSGAHMVSEVSYGEQSADDRNLETYFARNGQDPVWTIALEDWTDTNGLAPDFFLFEVGGNDVVTVRAILDGGALGQPVNVTGWSDTGHFPVTGPNPFQQVRGLAFRRSQLKDAAGALLGPAAVLDGIRIESATIDGAAFLAIDPGPPASTSDGDGSALVLRAGKVGEPVELGFRGPFSCETDLSPNPFLDMRLDVTFDGPGGQSMTVPGFFAGDGLGGECGILWKARFLPPSAGTWTATASFRTGPGVAQYLPANSGTPGLLDGATVDFLVTRWDPLSPGFSRWGHLAYVDDHYQKFERGPYFIKTGTNSPENFLGCRAFDGVGKQGSIGVLHSYAPHAGDWNPGDPLFVGRDHGVDSKGVIGAVNYLAEAGVNSMFMMLLNLGGDGQDAHPFLGPSGTPFDNLRYDTSRLEQWNAVFEHAASKGVAMHFGLAETETANQNWLDGGALGPERKIFYREMVARFAHHPAIKWMIIEENDWSVDKLRQFADFLGALDPYEHPIGFHNLPNDFSDFAQVLGEDRFEMSALQFDPNQASDQVEIWRANSAGAGKPWLMQAAEHTPFQQGATDMNGEDLRRRVLYDVLFSGGGIEWYAGWHDLPLGGDLSLEDFRTRDDIYQSSRVAREFLEAHTRFWEFQPLDDLVAGEDPAYGGAEVFASLGDTYAVFYPSGTTTGTLDLSAASGPMEARWYNPRTGAFNGTPQIIGGGGLWPVGAPPFAPGQDWILLVTKVRTLAADVHEISLSTGGDQDLVLDFGPARAGRPYLLVGTTSGLGDSFPYFGLTIPLQFDPYVRFTLGRSNTNFLQNTRGVLNGNGKATATVNFAPGVGVNFIGTTLHHVAVLHGPIDTVSNPVPLRIVP